MPHIHSQQLRVLQSCWQCTITDIDYDFGLALFRRMLPKSTRIQQVGMLGAKNNLLSLSVLSGFQRQHAGIRQFEQKWTSAQSCGRCEGVKKNM